MSSDLDNLMKLFRGGKKKSDSSSKNNKSLKKNGKKDNTLNIEDALPAVELSPEKEIEAVVASSDAKKAADIKKKFQMKAGGAAAAFLVISLLVYMAMQPSKGSMAYGICKTFIELNVRFPTTLRLSTVEELGSSVRIWFTSSDTFGSYRLELIQCHYKADPTGQVPFMLERIVRNRRELDSSAVERFNRVLPALFANPPDLTLPTPITDSLLNIQFETDKFRVPIF
jgi:hypothetical protein